MTPPFVVLHGLTLRKEWTNLFQHIRCVEWVDYFKNEELNESKTFSKKLSVPKFSRPPPKLISEETTTYVSRCVNKLRDNVTTIKVNYRTKNNLNKELKIVTLEIEKFSTRK